MRKFLLFLENRAEGTFWNINWLKSKALIFMTKKREQNSRQGFINQIFLNLK